MRLSSLALGFLLLGSYSAFSAGADMEEKDGIATHKLCDVNIKIGEDNISMAYKGEAKVNVGIKLTTSQISMLQAQMSTLQAEMTRIMQSQLVRLLEESHIAQATQESLELQQGAASEFDEDQRLLHLFGPHIDQHKDIQEIRGLLEGGRFIKQNAQPSFFDGLFYVVEKQPSLCAKVREINIDLDQDKDYTKNIYNLPSVLNHLMARTNLETIRLSQFKPDILVTSLASIRSNLTLKEADFRNNNLKAEHFDWITQRLPSGLERADFSDNVIQDRIDVIAYMLASESPPRQLGILKQKTGDLDEGVILEMVSNFGSTLTKIF